MVDAPVKRLYSCPSLSLSLSVPTAAALEKMSVIDSPENGDTGISSETPSEETLSKAAESGESSS